MPDHHAEGPTLVVDLAPGLYRLGRDVENPHVDRRKSPSDFKHKPVWKEGLKFVVVPDIHADQPGYYELEPVGDFARFLLWQPRRVLNREGEWDIARVRAIAQALVPIPEAEWSFRDAWWACGHRHGGADALLERLWKEGRVTIDDLRLPPVPKEGS